MCVCVCMCVCPLHRQFVISCQSGLCPHRSSRELSCMLASELSGPVCTLREGAEQAAPTFNLRFYSTLIICVSSAVSLPAWVCQSFFLCVWFACFLTPVTVLETKGTKVRLEESGSISNHVLGWYPILLLCNAITAPTCNSNLLLTQLK